MECTNHSASTSVIRPLLKTRPAQLPSSSVRHQPDPWTQPSSKVDVVYPTTLKDGMFQLSYGTDASVHHIKLIALTSYSQVSSSLVLTSIRTKDMDTIFIDYGRSSELHSQHPQHRHRSIYSFRSRSVSGLHLLSAKAAAPLQLRQDPDLPVYVLAML